MKYELIDEELQAQVDKMKLQIQKHHFDCIEGVPDHCIEVAIANYLYSLKEDTLPEKKICDETKCDSLSD